MPEIGTDGLFVGLSKDAKAAAVLEHLGTDKEVTIHQLTEKTGYTVAQVHSGIRHLREVKNCVVTNKHGPASTYKLAEDAPEVRDYAIRRMKHWQSEVQVIQKEMTLAISLLPGAEAVAVRRAMNILGLLLESLAMDEEVKKEHDRRERQLDRREAKLKAKQLARR